MTESQNGWPVLEPDSSKLITWIIPVEDEVDTKIRMRNGSAGFLLAHMALYFAERVEGLYEPVLDDWGHAYRPVRGYSQWSNHASGTAIDLNATDHPLGAENTFTDRQELLIRTRLRFYGGCIRWGGDYERRVDEMHFEINEDLETCERKAKDLMDTWRGKRLLEANPGQKAVILS